MKKIRVPYQKNNQELDLKGRKVVHTLIFDRKAVLYTSNKIRGNPDVIFSFLLMYLPLLL